MNLGFSHDFIMKIMTCVLTVLHRIQVNGQLLDSFVLNGQSADDILMFVLTSQQCIDLIDIRPPIFFYFFFVTQKQGNRLMSKSQIMFGKYTPPSIAQRVSNRLNIHRHVDHFTYIGATLFVGRVHSSVWNPIIRRIQTKITNWKSTLSHARKDNALRSICSTILNYWLPFQQMIIKTKNFFQSHLSLFFFFYGNEALLSIRILLQFLGNLLPCLGF